MADALRAGVGREQVLVLGTLLLMVLSGRGHATVPEPVCLAADRLRISRPVPNPALVRHDLGMTCSARRWAAQATKFSALLAVVARSRAFIRRRRAIC